MKTLVQFLTRNQIGQLETLGGKTPIKIIENGKPLTNQIVEGLELCDKHEQSEDIVGFNIVEVYNVQGNTKETVTYQNIYSY